MSKWFFDTLKTVTNLKIKYIILLTGKWYYNDFIY